MLRIQMKTNIAKDKAYSALLLSSTKICLTLDFLLKIVEDTNFYNFLDFQLLKYQSFGFPTLSNRNQHQTDSNSVLHLQTGASTILYLSIFTLTKHITMMRIRNVINIGFSSCFYLNKPNPQFQQCFSVGYNQAKFFFQAIKPEKKKAF